LNPEFIAEFLECLIDELGSVVVDNPSRDVEVVYYVIFDKLDHVRRLYFF